MKENNIEKVGVIKSHDEKNAFNHNNFFNCQKSIFQAFEGSFKDGFGFPNEQFWIGLQSTFLLVFVL